tara:strand:+ start:5611 stop:5862 length:252 start_codon:yes stop_codon:yes gene_type:complete
MPKLDALPSQMPLEPTDKQIASACFSLRHDFGLLSPDEKERYHQQCKLWWRAIAKEVNEPSQHPLVIEEGISISSPYINKEIP